MPPKAPTKKDLERGKRLAQEREKIWPTRVSAARSGMIALRTLSNYEKDGVDPSSEFLRILAERGADVYYILTGKRSLPGCEDERVRVRGEILQYVCELLRHTAEYIDTHGEDLGALEGYRNVMGWVSKAAADLVRDPESAAADLPEREGSSAAG